MPLMQVQLEHSSSDDLKTSFGCQANAKLQKYADTPERELFYYLINVDEFPAVWPRAKQLVTHYLGLAQATLQTDGALPEPLQYFAYRPEAFASHMETCYRYQVNSLPKALPLASPTRQQLIHVLKQYAPTALVDGCWLQNMSQASTCHTEIAARLFHLYTETIGNGETSRHYSNMYRDLLHSAQVYLPEITSRAFTTQSDIVDAAFTNPVFQLSLSLFPRVHLPEIIGFNLGHFFHRPDGLLGTLADDVKHHGFDDRYCRLYALADAPGQAARLAGEIVTLYLDQIQDDNQRQQHWQRLWTGVIVHTVISQRWLQDMHEYFATPKVLSPRDRMIAMVRHKAPYARNAHRNKTLGERRLNDWFAAEPFDAEGFLDALAASPYINRDAPLQSPFLTHLLSFGGPMFRIFTPQEQEIIAAWIKSLSSDPQPQEPASGAAAMSPGPKTSRPCRDHNDDTQQDLKRYARCSKRELYYYFVNVDLYPDVLPTAQAVARQYFDQARAIMRKRRLPLHLRFFPYSHEAFEQRIEAIYDTESNAYQEFVPPAKMPKQFSPLFAQQYAPFPMVDGCWLQNIAKAGTSHTEISTRLFRIYADEIGNASTTLNHPNVYRHFLASMNIDLPPTDSLAFAMQPALFDVAFEVPVLVLSASLCPKTFLPELIGVNLAIELSGLGNVYMTIIDELRYWDLDPYFFTLHLTIDNIASGHTAVAMETVQLYLDQILATSGQQAVQREWERIWTGYLAFDRANERTSQTIIRKIMLRLTLADVWRKVWGRISKTAPASDTP